MAVSQRTNKKARSTRKESSREETKKEIESGSNNHQSISNTEGSSFYKIGKTVFESLLIWLVMTYFLKNMILKELRNKEDEES